MQKTTPLSNAGCRQAKFIPDGKNNLFDGDDLFLAPIRNGAKTWQMNAVVAANTLQAVAKDWLTNEYAGWSSGHDKRITVIFKNDVFPQIGKGGVATITGPVILK